MITRIGERRCFYILVEARNVYIRGKLVFYRWFGTRGTLKLIATEWVPDNYPEETEVSGGEGSCPPCSREYLKLLTREHYISHNKIEQFCNCGKHRIRFFPKGIKMPDAVLEVYKITQMKCPNPKCGSSSVETIDVYTVRCIRCNWEDFCAGVDDFG